MYDILKINTNLNKKIFNDISFKQIELYVSIYSVFIVIMKCGESELFYR